MNSSTIEPFFDTPCRYQFWEHPTSFPIISQEDLVAVFKAHLPMGIPSLDISQEWATIQSKIDQVEFHSYGDTNDMVQYAGVPFVEFPTMEEYLNATVNPSFDSLRSVLIAKICAWLEHFGVQVKLLQHIDGRSYHAGVMRRIQVAGKCFEKFERNDCTVLHVDILNRDGKFKSDFILPLALTGKKVYQASLNILLSDGGYEPDSLFVHEVRYAAEQEQFFKGWRSDPYLVKNARVHKHLPKIGEPYMFSTYQHHDVRGGHLLSNRLTFGLFLIYVPDLNTIFLYS